MVFYQEESDSRLFRKAIKKLHEGELWIDRQTLKEVFSSKQVSQKVQLTKKEIEILDCICEWPDEQGDR